MYLLLSEDLPNTCEKFLASERVLEEVELELLIVPDSTGAPEEVTPLVPPSPSEEAEEEELSSLFAQPRKTKLIIARMISKFAEFFIGTSLNKNSVKNIQIHQDLISF